MTEYTPGKCTHDCAEVRGWLHVLRLLLLTVDRPMKMEGYISVSPTTHHN